jgi:hypothetical protein
MLNDRAQRLPEKEFIRRLVEAESCLVSSMRRQYWKWLILFSGNRKNRITKHESWNTVYVHSYNNVVCLPSVIWLSCPLLSDILTYRCFLIPDVKPFKWCWFRFYLSSLVQHVILPTGAIPVHFLKNFFLRYQYLKAIQDVILKEELNHSIYVYVLYVQFPFRLSD